LQSVEVVAVVRLEEDHFVARIERGHGGRGEAAGRTDGHDHFRHRIDFHAVEVRHLGGDALAKKIESFEFRVRGARSFDRFARAFDELRNGRKVADALAEIDSPDAFAFARHAADVRLHEAFETIADLVHGLIRSAMYNLQRWPVRAQRETHPGCRAHCEPCNV
jgi:hypothetical protein